MARRVFVILAFVLALNLGIPVVNALSPFSAGYSTQPSTDLNTAKIIGQVGCTTTSATTNGAYSCNASLGGSSSGTSGILGPVVNTILVFGNFFAALGFLANIAGGVLVPSYYLVQWFGGSNIPSSLTLFVAFYQGLVWFAYADGFMYILSGRDLLG